MIGPPNAMPYCSCSDCALRSVAGFDRIGSAPVLGRVVPERLGLELVGARARHGDDRRAAQLVELRLVVRRDDLVLADRELRERIAARQCLAADAAAQHVVLLADAIDEDVHAVRRLRAAANFAGRAIGAGDELHAGHDIGEREEVARVLRQRLDLLRRDVGCDFGGPRFAQRRRSDGHRLDVLLRGREAQIQARALTDLQRDQSRDRAGRSGDLDFIGAGGQAREDIAAFRIRLDPAGKPGLGVGRQHGRSGDRRLAGEDLAAQGCAHALRECMWRGGEQASGNSRGQQPAISPARESRSRVSWSVPNESKGYYFGAEYSASPMNALPAEFRRVRMKVIRAGTSVTYVSDPSLTNGMRAASAALLCPTLFDALGRSCRKLRQ